MTSPISRRSLLQSVSGLAAMLAASPACGLLPRASASRFNPYAAPVNTGPSSLTVPAVGATPAVPGTPASGWTCTALLTTGNHVNGYRMVGIPDGLGAFDNGDRTITVLMNHEIAPSCGIASSAASG